MTPVTPLLAAATLAVSTLAGSLGALLGIGGGVFLVPFLVLGLGLPFHEAAGVSLAAVIGTSSAVSAATAGRAVINLRLGMVLEVATAAGGLAGGITAQLLAPSTLQLIFAGMAVGVAAIMAARPDEVALPATEDPGPLGGRYVDTATGAILTYRVDRLSVGLFASFLAGNLSTLLGIGGGIIKVPALVTWCGVPMRVAAATSAFMIGVTATSGAVIYWGNGDLSPALAASAVIGTHLGSTLGLRFSGRARARNLRRLLAAVLIVVAVLMIVRALA